MSELSNKPSSVDDEIDLGEFFKSIKNFFKSILIGLINVFKFYYNHKLILLGLIIIGGISGYYYDKYSLKTYTNNLLVTTNFGSSDYLYTKVEALEVKLGQQDTLFLKDLFGKHYQKVKSIEIKPVLDIYDFVSRKNNQQLFQLLFEEEGDIEFIENPINSRNFRFHNIHLEVGGPDYHKDLSDSLINFFNTNPYFNEIRLLSRDNINLQLKENDRIINQIDSIIAYAKEDKSIRLGSTGLSFSDNKGLNDLLGKKKGLIMERRELESSLVNNSETIKVVDSNYKVLNQEEFLKKDKIKLFPLFFVILYSLIFLIRHISKKAKSLTS